MLCDSRNIIKDIFSKYANKECILNNLDYENDTKIKENLLEEKTNLETKLSENNNIKFNLYKDKINNVISEKDYIEFSNKLCKDILSLENRIKYINYEIEKITTNHKSKENMLQLVDKFLNTDTISRNDILQLIDKIELDTQCEHPKIKIFLKFSI